MLQARYAVFVVAAALGACAIQRAQIAAVAQSSMIGLTTDEVLICMGPAANKASDGVAEVWSYPSGDNHFSVEAAAGYGFVSGVDQIRYCVVNLTMVGGRVARVSYVGPTGGLLTPFEQCAFAVQNCVP